MARFKKNSVDILYGVWLPYWVSICISLMNNDVESLYMCSFVHVHIVVDTFFKNLLSIFSCLLFLLFSIDIFYGFEKCLSSYMWLTNLFLHSVFYLLVLLTICFEVQLAIFLVMDYAFDILSQQYFPKPKSQRFIPVFYSRSFIILGLTFRSMVQFDLKFIYGMVCTEVHFLHMAIQLV